MKPLKGRRFEILALRVQAIAIFQLQRFPHNIRGTGPNDLGLASQQSTV